MKETDDKIAVLGDSNYRFDIPKSMIIAAGRNAILDIDFLRHTNIRLTNCSIVYRRAHLKTK